MGEAREVWKYAIKAGLTKLMLPPHAEIVFSGFDPSGEICVWVELEVNAEFSESRGFAIFGTGWALPDEATHLGTVVQGAFVWHVYEVKP